MRDKAFSNLAAAIIYRAALDYEDIMIKKYSTKNGIISKDNENRLSELNKFFSSQWYYILTDIDPEKLKSSMETKAKNLVKSGKRRENFKSLWDPNME